MRILFISSCYPDEKQPQYCIFLEQQAKALKELGHEVDVLVPYPKDTEFANKSKRENKIQNGLNIYRIPFKVKSFKELIVTRDAKFISNIKDLLLKNNYEIVSIHYLLTDKVLEICLDACRHCGIKTVVHFHGLNVWKDYFHPHPILQKYHALRRQSVLHKADCFVGVSDKVSNVIRERIKNKPTFTVYNGVDPNLFFMSNDSLEKFRIICVANLIPIKGQAYLIDACCKMHEEGLDIELIIVGRGTDEENLIEKANSHNANDYIHFKGYIVYEKVIAELKNSDVFVMPSFLKR